MSEAVTEPSLMMTLIVSEESLVRKNTHRHTHRGRHGSMLTFSGGSGRNALINMPGKEVC